MNPTSQKTASAWVVGIWVVALSGIFPSSVLGSKVDMVRAPGDFQPGETLEFRFPVPMVAGEDLGMVEGSGPLLIEPELAGNFTWLSTRSGVFVPSEKVPLGSEFRFSLRPDLTGADGAPLGVRFSELVKTPDFQITRIERGVEDEEQVPADVTVRLAFNSAVKLDEGQFEFVSEEGGKIPAVVRFGTTADYFPLQPEEDDWDGRWADVDARERSAEDAEATGEPRALKNRLFVQPAGLLDPGIRWELRVLPGMETQDGRQSIADGHMIDLGRVQPFVLSRLLVANHLHSGPSVTLEFSEPLAPDIRSGNAEQFFRIQPEVPDLRFEEGWRSMVVRGEFDPGLSYVIEIEDGVVAANGNPFFGERTRNFRIPHVAPRVYLPEVVATQLAGGRGNFPVQSVNLSHLLLTARLVPPTEAVRAVAAFDHYRLNPWDQAEDGELFRKLPLDAVVGRVIHEDIVLFEEPVPDVEQGVLLDWSEIAAGDEKGTIFLMVEGEPIPGIPGKSPGAQALIQRTDLGVLWKQADSDLEVSVFSMKTGDPVENAVVELWDGEFEKLADGTTDADGKTSIRFASEPSWLQVSTRKDNHVLAMGSRARELPMAAFGLPVFYGSWNPGQEVESDLRGQIFCDRAIYLPGDTVHFYGLVRREGAEGLQVDADASGKISVFDPRWHLIREIAVRTNSEGAFEAELDTGALPLGRYNARLEMDGTQFPWFFPMVGTEFEVAEFQPDAFAVHLEMPEELSAVDDQFTAELEAEYFFGASLEVASVAWSLQLRRAGFSPTGFSKFEFLSHRAERAAPISIPGRGVMKRGVPFAIDSVLPPAVNAPWRGELVADVTDLNLQTVSASGTFRKESSDFYFGISRPGLYVLEAGREYEFSVAAVKPSGEPVDSPVVFSATLIRWDYDVVRVQGAGNAISFQREQNEVVVTRQNGRTGILQKVGGEWEVESGGSVAVLPDDPGTYSLRIQGRDSGGRSVESEVFFFVQGAGEVVWDYRHPSQIDLVPNKEQYEPGDIAEILVKTPISGDALVSIERGNSILRTFPVSLEGNAPVIEVPIEEGDGPNVFVNLTLVQGSEFSRRRVPSPEFRYGLCELRVEMDDHVLSVEVKPDEIDVVPGEEVRSVVSVADSLGRPVAGANVVFYAVDEGILSLMPYERPDPAGVFFTQVPLRVRTGLSLLDLFPEDPEDLRFGNKGYLIGGGGLEGPGMGIRERFPGTAVWKTGIRTNEAGEAEIRFTAPDALTSYRLFAVVHEGAARFGSGESMIRISKPLQLLPAMGMFVNAGDQMFARAVLTNRTGSDGMVIVDFEIQQNGEKIAKNRFHVALLDESTVPVEMPVRFEKPGMSRWTWSASFDTDAEVFSDQVAVEIPVGSPMLELREVAFRELPADSSIDLLEGVNPQIQEGMGEAGVAIASTRLASLRESARYLLTYPFGCAEQQTSALVPWIVAPTMREIFPMNGGGVEEAEVLGEGVQKLMELQTESGGLAFWKGGREPSRFASAWAMFVLGELARLGWEEPAGWDGLQEYLVGTLRGLGLEGRQTSETLEEAALVVAALAGAGKPQGAYQERLFEFRSELSLEGRALLALSMLRSGGYNKLRVQELLDANLPSPESLSMFGSQQRTLAIRLMALVTFDPGDSGVAPLLAELLASRSQSRWSNTQSNAWGLFALKDYWEKVEGGGVDEVAASGLISAKGLRKLFQISEQEPVFEAALPMLPGETAIQVANQSEQKVYVDSRFSVYPPLGEQPPQNRGFLVTRTFQNASVGQAGGAPSGSFEVGDRILVTIQIENPRPANFVAISDPLPSIFEAIHSGMQTRGGGELAGSQWESHRELRKDRVLIFCDRLPAGTHTFQYYARVRNAGAATAPATQVEEMYRPERFGLGTIQRLSAKPGMSR